MKILIADDEQKVCSALKLFFEEAAGWVVVAAAGEAYELLTHASNHYPDLVLLDWSLPGMQPAALIADLRQRCPGVQVIVYSGRLGLKKVSLYAGADAFVSKSESTEKLVSVIESVGQESTDQGITRADNPLPSQETEMQAGNNTD